MQAAGDTWVAIDFETANERRGSPCSVGMAKVASGQVVDRLAFLIRPPEFRFVPYNVLLHGITPDMCESADEWPAALERVLGFADGAPLVAHYAAFDMGVIRDACDEVMLPWPEVRYLCSWSTSRRTFEGLSSYSLPFVAAHCGIDLFDHHDAAADAETSAQVMLAAMRQRGVTTLAELADDLPAFWGQIEPDYWHGFRVKSLSAGGSSYRPLPTAADDSRFDRDNMFYDRTVVFTGELHIVRREAQQMVVDIGGRVSSGVSKKTDYLVTGYQDVTRLAAGESKSGKLRKAEALVAAGEDLQIITEGDFVRAIRSSEAEGGQRSGRVAV